MTLRCILTIVLGSGLCAGQVIRENQDLCEETSPFAARNKTVAEPAQWTATRYRAFCDSTEKPVLGLVSAHTLKHKPPKKARTEFHQGINFVQKGRLMDGVAHFEAAARMDTQFVDAYVQAGRTMFHLGLQTRALPYFTRAAELEPRSVPILAELAVTLTMVGRSDEAESVGRRALRIDSLSAEAHYAVGFAMIQQGKSTREILEHLALASQKFPNVHYDEVRVRELLMSGALQLAETE